MKKTVSLEWDELILVIKALVNWDGDDGQKSTTSEENKTWNNVLDKFLAVYREELKKMNKEKE